MWYQNSGRLEDEIIQNRFTSYLATAIQRRKTAYVQQLSKSQELLSYLDAYREDAVIEFEDHGLDRLPLLMKLQNEWLLNALSGLKERELYILLSHALDGKDFETLSKELGLSYKGVAAIYYRAVQKIRMEGNAKYDF